METVTRTERWAARLEGRARLVIWGALAVTGLLAVPFLTMAPDETASAEPGGAVFDARDAVEARFVSQVYGIFAITEARSGDILTAESLREVRDRSAALRSDPELGPTLFGYFDADTGVEVDGTLTIADLVDGLLPGGLDAADDRQVKAAVGALVDRFGADSDELALSQLARVDETAGGWVSPAIAQLVLADNDVLGFEAVGVDLGGDTEPEEYARDIVEVLRGDEALHQTWGVAIDVNLTSAEQGEAAGPFIGFTILAVLLVVGVTFRSYWVLAVCGAALGSLIVWLKGISNLLGLEDDLILSLIVPIAMISFGVDFAFHAVGRYREERRLGIAPRRAFVVGIAAVSGALVLALASDAAAFLSNVSSGIESIIQFGFGAAVALTAAFLLLGIVTPLVVAEIEAKVGAVRRAPGLGRAFVRLNAAMFAGLLAMATVLLMVYILPIAGVLALVIQIVVTLVVPYAMAPQGEAGAEVTPAEGRSRVAEAIGGGVAAVAGQRRWVIPLAALATVAAAYLAVQVPTEFDVKDFFSADTDFVVSLDKLDEHVGERAGEPAQLYVAAPLDRPEVLSEVAAFVADVRALASPDFARDDRGLRIEGGVLRMIEAVWASPAAQGALTQFTGVSLTDDDGDGLPDTEEQLDGLYGFARRAGVPFDATRLTQTPDEVRTSLWVSDDGTGHATVFSVGFVNSRAQESISAGRAALDPVVADLRARLAGLGVDATVEATGPPIVRQAALEAISRALQVSLPIAVVLCFLIAAAFMRSLRLAAVVIVPILMTVAWLYALMEVFGFAINVVTATIGAVSIGIGIDFAIHFAMRYREELPSASEPLDAVRIAAKGTGSALVASAASSIVGFAILAFAPMPLFASYGLLTAVMILMALAASLLVLPGLLLLVTPAPASGDSHAASS